MANYSVIESTKGTDSGSSVDDKGLITLVATRSWTIVSDTPGINPLVVQAVLQNYGNLPIEGQSHPDHFLMTCRSVKVTRESPIFFKATASYKSVKFEKGDEDETEPWDVSAKVSTSSVSSEAETDEDADGKLIANAGTNEPVTGVTRRITDVKMTIKKPFLAFGPMTIRTFNDKTNSDAYLGFPVGEGMIRSITAEPAMHGDIPYFEVSVDVLFRTPYQTTSAKAWYDRRAVKGFYELLGGEIIRCVDDEKNPVSQPVRLDATGKRLDAADPAVWKETKLYDSIAFSSMGFF